MVTHSSTSRPVQCLCMAERTGCPVFTDLWSYVLRKLILFYMIIVTTLQLKSFLLSSRVKSMFAKAGSSSFDFDHSDACISAISPSIFSTHILFGYARMQSRAHYDCNVFVDKLVSLVMQQADYAFTCAYTALEPKPMVSWPQSLAEDMASRRPSTPRARPCL